MEIIQSKESPVVEMSMRISKASYNKSEENAMRWTAIDSDTDEDLYKESMSVELYKDFEYRIKNNIPVPEPFVDVICEEHWCGGMPYLSVAHYKAGTGGGNVPGTIESVYVDGTRLKSKGTLYGNDLGRKVFDALCDDLYRKKSDPTHLPVRISIGFLDLEHKHIPGIGPEYTFTRTDVGQICPLCSQGVGGKIYMKGQLVHLALTRVPVNPRTEMVAEKSMDEITTKREDAKSIIGELADELEEKSIANAELVVKSDPTPAPSLIASCYDPNTDSYNQECVTSIMDKYMPAIRNDVGQPVNAKSFIAAVTAYLNKSYGLEPVEEVMEPKQEVEKSVAGIPVKPFSHTQDGVTITGDGNNTVSNPVKSDAEMEDEKEEKEEVKEMSTLDKSFDTLKSLLASGDATKVQEAMNQLGAEVEKSFTPAPPSANDVAAIVKSAVEAAVAPLRMELATLKAEKSATVVSDGVIKSKALNINSFKTPDQMIAKAITGPQPSKQLTQIEALARRSTGLQD